VAKPSIARNVPAEQTPSANQTRQLKKPDLLFVFIALVAQACSNGAMS